MEARIYSFLIILALLILAESFYPFFKKKRDFKRISYNFLLFFSSIACLKITLPYGFVELITRIELKNLSLISFSNLPFWTDLILTLIIFDFAIYLQHRLFHMIPKLWKSHQIHHCDKEMDFSTALRFHPIEIIISAMYKIAIILLVGPRAETYLIYEIVLNGLALFNHSNLYIAPKIDKVLRLFIVTPNMHFPHHSPEKRLTNSNYGNLLSIWDRIFKTYTDETNESFGLNSINHKQSNSLKSLLGLPFK